jgi:hypothetical protein
LTPVPAKLAAPPESVVLPAAAWEGVLAGELLAIDLGVLAAIAFVFQTGKLHPQVEKRRDAVWAPDETLIVRDGLHRLLPQWTETIEYHGDAVGFDRDGIESRLAETRWLSIERQGSEVAVRLGARLRDPDHSHPDPEST